MAKNKILLREIQTKKAVYFSFGLSPFSRCYLGLSISHVGSIKVFGRKNSQGKKVLLYAITTTGPNTSNNFHVRLFGSHHDQEPGVIEEGDNGGRPVATKKVLEFFAIIAGVVLYLPLKKSRNVCTERSGINLQWYASSSRKTRNAQVGLEAAGR